MIILIRAQLSVPDSSSFYGITCLLPGHGPTHPDGRRASQTPPAPLSANCSPHIRSSIVVLVVIRVPLTTPTICCGVGVKEGELVTRAEIAQRLWSSEVFVDTEHGINTAIRKIRNLLRDSPDNPRFVQTVTGMGYRFIASVASIGPPPGSLTVAPGPVAVPAMTTVTPLPRAHHRRWLAFGTAATLAIVLLALIPGTHRLAALLLHRDAAPAITSLAVTRWTISPVTPPRSTSPMV